MTSSQIHGAFWKIVACLCFAALNNMIKWLTLTLPVETIAFFQNVFGVLCLLPFFWNKPWQRLQSKRLDLQFWRVIASFTGTFLWYQAIKFMPIGQAVALNFTGPLITVLGASFCLGERLSMVRILSILLGFTGGILIINARYLAGELPFGSQGLTALFPLSSAAAFAICTLLNKKLTHYDAPPLIVIYLMGCMVPLFGLMAWGVGVWPSLEAFVYLLILGALSAAAQLALTRSFVCTDITFLLPFGSIRLLASSFFAWILFGQPLNSWIFAGFSFVMMALFILARFEKQPAQESF